MNHFSALSRSLKHTHSMALLRNQFHHRSSQRGSLSLIDFHHLNIEEQNPILLPYLEQAGFLTTATLGFCKVDKALLTDMVERWRDETHTFHLLTRECTITLEDVALQLGLPIDGRPVTGPSMCRRDAICEEILGEAPPANQMVGQYVKLK